VGRVALISAVIRVEKSGEETDCRGGWRFRRLGRRGGGRGRVAADRTVSGAAAGAAAWKWRRMVPDAASAAIAASATAAVADAPREGGRGGAGQRADNGRCHGRRQRGCGQNLTAAPAANIVAAATAAATATAAASAAAVDNGVGLAVWRVSFRSVRGIP